jgi:hypothetical protein
MGIFEQYQYFIAITKRMVLNRPADEDLDRGSAQAKDTRSLAEVCSIFWILCSCLGSQGLSTLLFVTAP